MNQITLLLVLAYVVLAALVLLTLIKGRLPTLVKLILVIGTSALYFVSYQGWKSSQGWATATPLPERFLLHASVIQEPDKSTGSPGSVYIWVSDLVDGKPADEPRAYAVSYDKKLHSDLEDALRGMRNGVVQLGRVTRVTDKPDRPTDVTRMGERREKVEIHALPDPALPEK
ncbi:MAG: hypothetical protein GY703_13290 [Gammaproteobacteria bacterium]|nr:hypothetical protein [Gammaproteobacteria bacterium]